MTAEVAVMNKLAVALAADSAVTVGGRTQPKIYDTVNKLFALSKYHPVGVMVYGGAEFMGIPWESVIKVYRSTLGRTRFSSLKEYASHFLAFLEDDRTFITPAIELDYVTEAARRHFKSVHDAITKRLEAKTAEESQEDSIDQALGNLEVHWNNEEKLWPTLGDDHTQQVLTAYGEALTKIRKDVFEAMQVNDGAGSRLDRLCAIMLCKAFSGYSGVVFAGFGHVEVYPSLWSYFVESRLSGKLKQRDYMNAVMGAESGASITPFAQQDMVDVFMRGIDSRYKKTIEDFWAKVLADYPEHKLSQVQALSPEQRSSVLTAWKEVGGDLVKAFREVIRGYEREKFIDPVLDAVASLPKDELAVMAETFVSLTKFKRRVTTSEAETVGGPIDVAVISKGDGFVWIKRKHYFPADLNAPFIARYLLDAEEQAGGSE